MLAPGLPSLPLYASLHEDAACVQLWSQMLVSSPSQSSQQLLTSSAHSHQQPGNAHSSSAARSDVQIRCQQTSRKMNSLQPSIQRKLQQAAASLQTGLEDHRHRLCRTIQHAAEVAAALDQQLGLQGQRRRVNRALVRGLQRLTAAVQGGQWHHRHGSQGSLFASMSMPFLRRRPQGELMPIEKLKELFDELDQHDHGRLSIADFRAGLARMGLPCSEDYLREMMNQYDEDHDGTVDFQEFQHYVHHRRRSMRAAFEEMDFHHTGTIDADDLLEDLKKAGLPAKPEDAKKMIDLLDRDHDGRVSFDEFQRYLCLLPAAQVVHHNVIYCWMDSSDWVDGIEYRLCMTPPKQPLQRLLAGGLAGAVSRTMVAPAERLRTLMMTDKTGAGFMMSFRQMWADGGFRGMFKGNLVTVLKTIPQSAIQFAAYDQAKDAMLTIIPRDQGAGLRQIEKALAGCTAGAVSTILTYPMELLRTRMSMSGAQNLSRTIASIVAGQGIAGFYRGFYASLLCDVLANGLGFWSYERGQEVFRNKHNGRSPNPTQKAGIGALTAVFVMTSTMPIEVVMRRLQVQGAPGHVAQYKGAVHCLQSILREEGPKAFYRGTLSSYLKVCPSIAVTYGLYAFIIQLWGIGGLRQYPHADKVNASAEEATAAQASS